MKDLAAYSAWCCLGVVSLGVINPEKEVYKFTYPGQVHALDAALSLSEAPPKQAWRKAKRKVKETAAEAAARRQREHIAQKAKEEDALSDVRVVVRAANNDERRHQKISTG